MLTLNTRPIRMKELKSELRPAETKGSGMPVFGSTRRDTPILMKLWKAIMAPQVPAMIFPA